LGKNKVYDWLDNSKKFFFDTFTVGEAPTVSFYIYMKNMYKDTETESKVQGGKKLQKKMKITRPER
jgi:hypothetical protein